MRKNLVAIFLFLSSAAFSQEELVTTFILVRHAEKDLTQSTNDPDLSAEGKTRADAPGGDVEENRSPGNL
jgi:hypothetical protein